MKNITLSVCMIVKNEENNIGRCLGSIRHIADEMIVVDTGSTDRTIEIAKGYGATVIEDLWQDDFSKARNCSLRAATKDWILFLDADEALSEEDGRKLKQIINDKRNTYAAYYFRLLTMVGGENIREAVVMRLFKNDPTFEFVGRIHEQIIGAIQAKYGMNCTANTDLKILHYGYDQGEAVNKGKNRRNIDLLLKCSEEEKHCYYYYVLGNEYLRAEETNEAIACYEKSYNSVDYATYNYMHYPYLVMNLVRMYLEKEYYHRAIAFIEKVRPTLAHFKDLYFMEMLAYIECGKLVQGRRCLRAYLECPEKQVYEYPCNYFENSYDIESIRKQLDEKAIEVTEGQLLTLVVGSSDTSKLIDTIKSVNGISNRLIVVGVEPVMKVEEYGIIFKTPLELEGEEVGGEKWVLLLKAGKICGLDECRDIVGATFGKTGEDYTLFDNTADPLSPVKFGKLIRNQKDLLIQAYNELLA